MNDRGLSINIARAVGKGNNEVASSIVVPSLAQLESAGSGEVPALFLLATLTSEKPVGADKVLPLALETMADHFYSGYGGKTLHLMEEVAKASQDILAELFFKAGFANDAFRVSLDIAMVGLLREVFYVWIDGELSVHFVRDGKSADLRGSFGAEGQERFTGSGRFKVGDKLLVCTDALAKKEWLLDQLKCSSVAPDVVLTSIGSLTAKEGSLIVGFGRDEVEPEKEKTVEGDEADFGDGEDEEKTVGEVIKEEARASKKIDEVELHDDFAGAGTGAGSDEDETEGESHERGEGRKEGSKFDREKTLQEVRDRAGNFLSSFWSVGWLVKLRAVVKDWFKAIGYALSSFAAKIFGGRGRRVAGRQGLPATQDRGRVIKGIVGIILLLGLCGGIVYLANVSFKGNKAEAEYQASLDTITSDTAALETSAADLTISDSTKLATADEITSRIETLKTNKYADTTVLDALLARVQAVRDTVTDTVGIVALDIINDVSVNFDGVNAVDFAIHGSAAYILDQSGGRVFVIDLVSKAVSLYASSDDLKTGTAISWTKASKSSDDRLFVYTTGGGVFEVKNTGEVSHVAGLTDFDSALAEMGTYLENFYFLLPGERAIYKSSASGSGFTLAKSYNSAPIVTEAVDVAIDGAIWVISNNGAIQRMNRETSGVKISDVAVTGMPNVLGAGCRIATPLTSQTSLKQYLYILDPSGKRVVAIDKNPSDGRNYVGQIEYRGDSGFFVSLKEIQLSSDGGSAYVLDGSTLIRVDLSVI